MKTFKRFSKSIVARIRHCYLRKRLAQPVQQTKNSSGEESDTFIIAIDEPIYTQHKEAQSPPVTLQSKDQNVEPINQTQNISAATTKVVSSNPRTSIASTPTPNPVPWSSSSSKSPNSLSPEHYLLSHQHSHASFTSSKQSTDGTWLYEQLRHVRIKFPEQSQNFMIPTCQQKSLITIENIEREIRDEDTDTTLEPKEVRNVAERAHMTALKVFGILTCLYKGVDIFGLLNDGISDKDLPLRVRTDKNNHCILERRSRVPIKTFENWTQKELEEFDRIQWWMIPPIFQKGTHLELEESAILPFVSLGRGSGIEKKGRGGYSVVSAMQIHPSHHNFWERTESADNGGIVAVKTLFSSDEKEFLNEAHILWNLESQQPKDNHLITLLATYKHRDQYHLIFPWADANLRTFWNDRPSPISDEQTLLWALGEMEGIAHSLKCIHNFKTSHTIPRNGNGNSGAQKEILYGRHGDIKAENILWFVENSGTANRRGILKIADFGLGSFHHRDSRSNINPAGVRGSQAYKPPECDLQKYVSRAYDIWSLGCLYLEFVSWLLTGSAEIQGLSKESSFFMITNHGRDAVVCEIVLVWVQELHKHERCSAMIHDLLDLIMEEVLIPDSQKRIPAGWLWHKLRKLKRRAAQDKVYLFEPVPWIQKPQPHLKANIIGQNALATTNKRPVSPLNDASSNFSSIIQPSLPKDLLRRVEGTPAHLGRPRRLQTWATMPAYSKVPG